MAAKSVHTGPGPTQRQLRVGELLRRAISDILARGDLHDPDLSGRSITVGEVRTSPDLKIATVFVLPLGGMDTDLVIKALARSQGELRRMVSKKVALKYAPELRFRADTSFDQMDATRRLLDSDDVQRDVARGADGDALPDQDS
ncbi:30S ribosome-binding factor RbfA [Oceanomicrobium pacificus]|uniref:Ribosome-binding factor A n=1 Tax=Oceanomicrobium pacificus TaxID=2692916 RepID=A0A6B0TS48_9RHOB|nr:30S ribosome-binding factor RbfA [Oceanomicrobium pacificus]MXU64164.1 30S ribosome-binding factor RbfA [Oceanomicrobium pacificus]